MANFQQQIEKAKAIEAWKDFKQLLSSSEVLKRKFDKNREQIYENSEDINGQAMGFIPYATELITKGRKKRRTFRW
jgi:hypothetical protein